MTYAYGATDYRWGKQLKKKYEKEYFSRREPCAELFLPRHKRFARQRMSYCLGH